MPNEMLNFTHMIVYLYINVMSEKVRRNIEKLQIFHLSLIQYRHIEKMSSKASVLHNTNNIDIFDISQYFQYTDPPLVCLSAAIKVSQMFHPWKNLTNPRQFMVVVGAFSWRPSMCHTHYTMFQLLLTNNEHSLYLLSVELSFIQAHHLICIDSFVPVHAETSSRWCSVGRRIFIQ